MKLRARHILSLLLTAILGCQDEQPAVEPTASSVVSLPPDVGADKDTQLYAVRGLQGLIDSGDELAVMVYGQSSREASIRAENIAAGNSSLERWLRKNPPRRTNLIRVPDLDDESGSRFYYFQRSHGANFQFKAICAGAWHDDPESPAICDETIEVADKVVSLEYSEAMFLRNRQAVAKIVLPALTELGAF